LKRREKMLRDAGAQEMQLNQKQLAAHMRETHALCEEHGDVASASLLEVWIDEAERRAWFLFETTRHG